MSMCVFILYSSLNTISRTGRVSSSSINASIHSGNNSRFLLDYYFLHFPSKLSTILIKVKKYTREQESRNEN
jgi:hypothetical protein